jgi:multidrug resistance efflux pump
MDKTEKKRYQYITAPATVIAAFVWLAWVIVSWTTLNNRVQNLEDFKSEVNIVEIQSTLTSIQKDVEWIREQLRK